MRNTAQTTVPATFKPSGGIVAPAPVEPVVEAAPASPTATADLFAAWQSMTVREAAETPIDQLLILLGVTVTEVEPDALQDGINARFCGRIGFAEIWLSRTLPQADREPAVRDFLATISTDDRILLRGAAATPHLVRQVTARLDCYDWCVEDHDHYTGHIEDISHTSSQAALMVAERHGDVPLLHAYINVDPFGTAPESRVPHLIVSDETETWPMPLLGAIEFAAQLTVFADEVRALAVRAAGRADDTVSSPEPGHFPWCDTGACTTNEHVGPEFNMPVPPGLHAEHDELLNAKLGAHEEFGGKPEISLSSNGEGTLLDVAAADKVIADLEATVAAMRAMRAQMVQGQQA
ncbi:DUF6907 domain-containing protein [Streptomyces sp. NPDC001822]|uniref:DUF6907 domain-containing protein n=1 Tax=Streptomyces sp. NPDC001822 TaxID=3364614 RepID=UPI0036B3CE55